MLHKVLNLTRPLFVLDTETTGTDPQRDRIVEIGFQAWEASGMTREWRSLVNPGVPIPASATKVHGITDTMMRQCTRCSLPAKNPVIPPLFSDSKFCECAEFHPVPHFRQIAESLAKGFTGCDFAGQSVRFDLRITAAEMTRAEVEWDYAGARIVDSSQLERLAVPRSLSHLHEKYVGCRHDGAHGALSDVRAAATVIVHQLQAHPQLPRDLDTLHLAQWGDVIDSDGKFQFIDGVATCMFGKWRGRAMRDIPVEYYDWLCRSDFTLEVKQLAADAKLGKYPSEK